MSAADASAGWGSACGLANHAPAWDALLAESRRFPVNQLHGWEAAVALGAFDLRQAFAQDAQRLQTFSQTLHARVGR